MVLLNNLIIRPTLQMEEETHWKSNKDTDKHTSQKGPSLIQRTVRAEDRKPFS